MNAWQFASENPITTVGIVWMALVFSGQAWKRFMRMLTIRKHGWPPPHCDAEGNPPDFEEEETECGTETKG